MKIKDEKLKAFALRKKGKSYGQISSTLNISKSTVSGWFKDIDWSKAIKKQLMEKARRTSSKRLTHLNNLKRKKWNDCYMEAEKEAIKEFTRLKNNKLFITGISLYWGEGDKVFKNGIVRISNIDSQLLKVFNDFLKVNCNISDQKIRAGILLYPDLDSKKCLDFWSKEINIKKDKFFQSTVIQGKHKTRRLGHGVCIVSVHDKYFKKKIITWLELFGKELSAGIV